MHYPETTFSDFALFPTTLPVTTVHSQSKMLAVMPPRQQEAPFFQNMTMDPSMADLFTLPMDNGNAFGPNHDSARVPTSYYDTHSVYAEDLQKPTAYPPMPGSPPVLTSQAPEPHLPGLSSASGPSLDSTPSSAIGSPYSNTTQNFQEGWTDTSNGLGLVGAVVGDPLAHDYMGSTMDPEAFYQKGCSDSFVSKFYWSPIFMVPTRFLLLNAAPDPSLIEALPQQPSISSPTVTYSEQPNYMTQEPSFLPQTPGAASPVPILETLHAETEEHYPSDAQPLSPSGMLPGNPPYQSVQDRRSSVSSSRTGGSRHSPAASSPGNDDEPREKGRCPHPDCGRPVRDLKSHMLSHLSERPEKCPLVNCEWHVKGFARKYDKNRHTLTHYKGTMVCGFCPGSGSPAEKSFNRTDVFKRHLTAVHGVEQTPPNCRKKNPSAAARRNATSSATNATGKCSECAVTFSNPQDLYEHLDDCCLRSVQQEKPTESINQQRLAEVDSDVELKKTMEKHQLIDTAGPCDQSDDDHEGNDHDDSYNNQRSGKGSITKTIKGTQNNRPIVGKNNAVTKNSSKPTTTTNNKNKNNKARPVVSRRRNNRDYYPQSWGCPSSSMKTKKRVLCVFDGPRRLWKDEMMLDNEFEVRLQLPGGAGDGTNRDVYITDLDVETLKRADGVLSATAAERGPWVDGPSNQIIGQPAMPLPGLSRPEEEIVDVNIDELMA